MRQGKYTILVVEDDRKLAQSLREYFSANDYIVCCAADGNEAVDLFFSNNHEIDLILLDIMLPKGNGYEVLKEIRQFSDVPIIMTTSKESEEDQLEALNNGADNYITKPYRLSVLKAHVEILLNRKVNKERFMKTGKLKVDLLAQRVFLYDEELTVTPKEFSLLVYLMRNTKVVLSREAILDAVWGFDYEGDIRTVDTLVKQLRKKIAPNGNYIHSVYGVGYYFEEKIDE
nr:response regulator transcription factor [Lachnospiraceae bacterium]